MRVVPNAGRTALEEAVALADGRTVLRLRVTAIPDKNKANLAVVALMAEALGVARSAVTITAGHTARLKTLRITGDGPALAAALSSVLQRLRDETSH